MFAYQGITIHWLGHDGFLLEKAGFRIVIDPFKTTLEKPVSLVLITHEHSDHLSIEDLKKVVSDRTVIACPQECLSSLSKVKPKEVVPMRPGQTKKFGPISVTAIPAYNVNKYRDPATKTVFHPKADEKIGYLIDFEGTTIYHSGDTDFTDEMEQVKCDIALLPVSGTYVMTADEAANAAKRIKPKVAIPMHWGTIIGTEADAHRFAKAIGNACKVGILAKE